MNFPQLNFSNYEFRTQHSDGKTLVFDIVRKKFVTLTPEEWVRQHVIRFLTDTHQVSINRIAVEYFLNWNNLSHRCDILVFDADFKPMLIVECKSAKVSLSQKVFDQIARYNITLKVPYLMVTNGLQHIYAAVDFSEGKYQFLEKISFK